MKLWIARYKDGYLGLYTNCPTWDISEFSFTEDWVGNLIGVLGRLDFPEVTFENSPMEIELKIPTIKSLTRDYFSNHNWKIVIHEPDENGFILWEAKWKRSMEEGSPYYSDLTVTNMMYEDRFCISGKTSKGSVGYLMAYTEEDLINILKVFAIYGFYEQESKKLNLN